MTAGPRRVHGVTSHAEGARWIVRYDAAGKWFVERNALDPGRVRIDLATAVLLATQEGATPYLGVSGGQRFDAEVRRVLRARAA